MIIDFPVYLVSFRILKDFVTDIQIRARNNQFIRRMIKSLENVIILPYFIRKLSMKTSKY
jgi:hypothetical protein